MRARKEKRNQKALELRRSGMIYKEIGEALGITKDRARKIVINQERWEKEAEKKTNG